jgi:hypothetical protein
MNRPTPEFPTKENERSGRENLLGNLVRFCFKRPKRKEELRVKRKRYPGAVPSAIPVLEKLRGIVNTILAEELEPEGKTKKKGGEKNAGSLKDREGRTRDVG